MLDDRTGQPLSGATVRISDRTVVTEPDGKFYFSGVPEGPCPLTVTSAGYQTSSQNISITKDATATVTVNLMPITTGSAQEYDVIVVGAGTGGISAAVQASRMGMRVALLEETDWIGGQMTAAAVTSMDEGYPVIRTGIYREFIDLVTAYYRLRGKSIGTAYFTPKSIAFEPSVGQRVLYSIIGDTAMRGGMPTLDLFLRSKVKSAVLSGQNTVTGVETENGVTFSGKVVIDATEYGDLLPLTPARYRIGNSTSDVPNATACIQPITIAAVIKRYPGGVPTELSLNAEPPLFDSRHYSWYLTKDGYPWLQNNLFIAPINFDFYKAWRGMPDSSNPENYDAGRQLHGLITKTGMNTSMNDYPATVAYLENSDLRRQVNCKAMLRALNNLYYIRSELGETEWTVANDEGFNTPYNIANNACDSIPTVYKPVLDHFPVIPYVREGRRLIGIMTLRAADIQRDGKQAYRNFLSSLAVGVYPVDLHGCKTDADLDCGDKSSDIVSDWNMAGGLFQVPFEVFIPETVDGFLVAEKNLSVSRLVNGAIRLQPITMMTGQAAGAIAAVAVRQGKRPREVTPIDVQRELLNSHCLLARDYMTDVPMTHPFWKQIQLVSLYEIMSGSSVTYTFGVNNPFPANELSTVTTNAFGSDWSDSGVIPTSPTVTRAEMAAAVGHAINLELPLDSGPQVYSDVPPDHPAYAYVQLLTKNGIVFGCSSSPSLYCPDAPATRGEAAAFIANALWSTERIPATYTGLTTTALPAGSIMINNGAAITNSASVALTLQASDAGASVTNMQLKKECTDWYPWEPYTVTRAAQLTAGDGLKIIFVRFRDSAWNISAVTSTSILLDTTPPVGTITINGGAATTTSASVILTLSASDENSVVSMRFSKDNQTWYGWEPYAETRPVTLLPGPGEKTIYVRFKDSAGNVSAVYSATITLL